MAQVRVDDADDRRSGRLESFDDRRPQSELAAAMNHLNPVLLREVVGNGAGAIRRVVIHDHQLAVEATLRVRLEHRPDQIPEAVALVVRGDDDGQRWRGGGGQRMRLDSTITQPPLAFLLMAAATTP